MADLVDTATIKDITRALWANIIQKKAERVVTVCTKRISK